MLLQMYLNPIATRGGGQILPTIAEVAPKFFPWLRPCINIGILKPQPETNVLLKKISRPSRDTEIHTTLKIGLFYSFKFDSIQTV